MHLLFIYLQEEPKDAGYDIGYAIGQNLPYVLFIVFAYFIFRYFKNKSKE